MSFNCPTIFLEALDELVDSGLIKNRSEGVRIAVRDFVKIEYLLKVAIQKGRGKIGETKVLEMKHIKEEFPIRNVKSIEDIRDFCKEL